MKRNSLILSLILAIGAAVAHPAAEMAQSPRENSEARKLWSEGNDLYNDGNFADAEKKFREALTKYPKSDPFRSFHLLPDYHTREASPLPGCPHRDRELPAKFSGIQMER